MEEGERKIAQITAVSKDDAIIVLSLQRAVVENRDDKVLARPHLKNREPKTNSRLGTHPVLKK